MTFEKLSQIIEDNNIPNDVKLTSDSGWECCATEMEGVFYNETRNEIVFTQYVSKSGGYLGVEGWRLLYGVDLYGNEVKTE